MTYKINRIQFASTDKVHTIYAVAYLPEHPRGIVQICHGMQEHMGRYDEVMRFLAEHGYLACGHDHLGHGLTAASEQDFGFFAESGGAKLLAGDLCKLSRLMREEFRPLPLVLLGHSMGSFVARMAAVSHPELYRGLILSGTAGPMPVDAAIKLDEYYIRARGAHYRPKLVQRLAFSSMNRHCHPHRTRSDWLSRDDAVVDAFLADPLCDFQFTASAFRDLFVMMKAVNSKRWYHSYPSEMPTLLISGSEDPVGGYGKGGEKVRRQLKNCGVRDLELLLYPGGRHEMLGEVNRRQVYEDLLAWLEERYPFGGGESPRCAGI